MRKIDFDILVVYRLTIRNTFLNGFPKSRF